MIASRYARALMHLTPSKEEVEKCVEALDQVKEILSPYSSFFHTKRVSWEEKERVLKKGFGAALETNVLSFLLLINKRKRLDDFPKIVHAYRELAEKKLGILKAKLRTPEPLSEAVKEQFKEKLEKRYKKTIVLSEEIRPRLLGGGILRIGNQQADFSLRGKLMKLKKNLLSLNVEVKE